MTSFITRLGALVLLLSVLSTSYVAVRLIVRFAPDRIAMAHAILNDQAEPPYQYRVLKPVLGEALGHVFAPLARTPVARHVAGYSALTFLAFLALYSCFGLYLRTLFSEQASLLGVALLQSVIPLTVTGYYMEGDFINAAFYASGFLLMALKRDAYLPVLVAIATLNREQTIFLVALYGLWLFTHQRLTRRTVGIFVGCLVAYILVFLGLRLYFGFKPSRYTIPFHIAANLDLSNLLGKTVPLWLAELGVLVVLCLSVYRRSNLFFRLAFLGLIPYALLFFFNGLLWETAKFLPAFLILLPMALQLLVNEFPPRPTHQ